MSRQTWRAPPADRSKWQQRQTDERDGIHIEANMNMDTYRDAVDREDGEASDLANIRREIIDALNF